MSTRRERDDLVAAMFQELRRTVANSVLFNLRMADLLKMNPTDLQFINLLDIHGPLTPGRLAELSKLTTGGVTVALDRLEKAGAIRREPNLEDRRSSVVYVEAKFLRSAQTAYQKMGEATDALLAQFSDEELGFILGFLRKINEIQI